MKKKENLISAENIYSHRESKNERAKMIEKIDKNKQINEEVKKNKFYLAAILICFNVIYYFYYFFLN